MHKDNKLDILIIAEEGVELPQYASTDAAGADIRAHIKSDIVLAPGSSVVVPTGLRMAIPPGYEVQLRPRSGLALKHQITLLNTPGTIDADYRGEIGVILINHGRVPFVITPGMRIAQMIVAPVFQANFVQADILASTERGGGGFGHTGIH